MKKVLFLLLFAMVAVAMVAQTAVRRPNINYEPSNSIIRECTALTNEVFSIENYGKSYFYYPKPGNPSMYLEAVLPDSIVASDMICLGRRVYFGGHDTNKCALLGTFDIWDLFMTGGDINICRLDPQEGLIDIPKISGFQYGGKDVIAFVGTRQIGELEFHGVIGEADYNMNSWWVKYDMDHHWEHDYNDVTVIDDAVVAIGGDQREPIFFMNGWKRLQGFLSNPMYNYREYIFRYDEDSLYNFRLAPMVKDTVAIAYNYIIDTNFGMGVGRCIVDWSGITCNRAVRNTENIFGEPDEMIYNPVLENLFVVRGKGFVDIFDRYLLWSFAQCRNYWVDNLKPQTIDNKQGAGYQIFGNRGCVFDNAITPTPCAEDKKYEIKKHDIRCVERAFWPEIHEPNFDTFIISPNINVVDCDTICIQEY